MKKLLALVTDAIIIFCLCGCNASSEKNVIGTWVLVGDDNEIVLYKGGTGTRNGSNITWEFDDGIVNITNSEDTVYIPYVDNGFEIKVPQSTTGYRLEKSGNTYKLVLLKDNTVVYVKSK